jgi:uracil-DNA glycosylase
VIKELLHARLSADWSQVFQSAACTAALLKIEQALERELRAGHVFFPPPERIFFALEQVPLERVKVILLGQDPYHGPGQATGLSFAVPNKLEKKPPSLRNLLKELYSDIGVETDRALSDLSGWADQGVLLLNSLLTVRAGQPLSHSGIGWEEVTSSVLSALAERNPGVVFLLLGTPAQKLGNRFRSSQNRFIEAPHPSPLSAHRGFFGSRVFSRVNEALLEIGQTPIDWGRISLK